MTSLNEDHDTDTTAAGEGTKTFLTRRLKIIIAAVSFAAIFGIATLIVVDRFTATESKNDGIFSIGTDSVDIGAKVNIGGSSDGSSSAQDASFDRKRPETKFNVDNVTTINTFNGDVSDFIELNSNQTTAAASLVRKSSPGSSSATHCSISEGL